MQQPFIIIGMHRSGTTFVANTLNKAGIFMGVMRDANGEALHFMSLNQQMLWANKASWLEPKVPAKSLALPANQIYAEHIKSTSQNKWRLMLQYNGAWGWKDPRNTYTLKHWLKVFPHAKIIHVVRDGRHVALSLKARNTVAGEVFDKRLNDLSFNFELWENYVVEAKSWQQKCATNYCEISYEKFVAQDKNEVEKLERFTKKEIKKHVAPKHTAAKIIPHSLSELAQNSAIFRDLYISQPS